MPKTKQTKRTISDPRVARVIRAIDRAIASPHVGEILCGSVERLVTFGNSTQSFDKRDGWTPANARATVIALALNVPEPLLGLLAKVADDERAWVARWDRRTWLECQVPGGSAKTLPQLKREYAAMYPEAA